MAGTAQVAWGARFVESGDSITVANWAGVSGGVVDQINAQIPTNTATRLARASASGSTRSRLATGGTAARTSPSSMKPAIVVLNTAIAGQLTQNLLADVANQITSQKPDVVVLHIGINDSWAPVDPTTVTKPNYEAILQAIRAYSSTCTIVCVGLQYFGEQWAAGPVWSNTPSFDGNIDLNNTFIQQLCVTYNCTYVELRAAELVYETVNNAPAPGARTGILSQDGLHPTIPTGQLFMCNLVAPVFKVGP